MTAVAYDTETYPIYQTGKATCDTVPRMVCLSWADADHPEGVLLNRTDGIDWWLAQLDAGNQLVGANLAFDLNVMLRAVEEDRPERYEQAFKQVFAASKWDVQVQARLEDISRGGMFMRGGYTLGELERRYLPEGVRTTEKKGVNVWRLRYNELEGVPVVDYPADAARYALEDAVNTWAVFSALKASRNKNGTGVRSQYDWEMSLMSAWGLMVDQEWVGWLVEFYEAERAQALETLRAAGVIREDGTKSMAAIRELFELAFISVGLTPMRSDSGKFVATNRAAQNALEDAGAFDPSDKESPFSAYVRFNRADKFIATYLKPLADAGDLPLCPRFNVLVDSGRTSSSGPNVQNFPSRESAQDRALLATMLDELSEDDDDDVRMMRGFVTGPDIRGAIVPRPGFVFVGADYSAIEMAGVAQNCRNLFGELGTLGVAINRGVDLHCVVGAQILGIAYEDFMVRLAAGDPAAKRVRTISKIANYGYWGGATPQTFRGFARQQGERVDFLTAEEALRSMKRTWTEMEPYFAHIAGLQQRNGSFYVEQHGPDRRTSGWRLRVTKKFTQAANTLFQGIVADGALWSLHLIMQDLYLNEASPLRGSRVSLFVHDEFVLEVPAAAAEPAGARLAELMVAGMKRFLPDLLVQAAPNVMETRWTK